MSRQAGRGRHSLTSGPPAVGCCLDHSQKSSSNGRDSPPRECVLACPGHAAAEASKSRLRVSSLGNGHSRPRPQPPPAFPVCTTLTLRILEHRRPGILSEGSCCKFQPPYEHADPASICTSLSFSSCCDRSGSRGKSSSVPFSGRGSISGRLAFLCSPTSLSRSVEVHSNPAGTRRPT